ncbi:HEAT repeat domain-containing protein [Actinomadura scrupuli]|uniref:HEAT repeat domain-containing protein n=1 Tax=Actinomadura scrupuli TaxID=559629 RepID=UPI003D997746
MFNGLHDIDWSSMEHAYGSAEEIPSLLSALCSTDAEERNKALSRFYGAVHHQGDVYLCTTASLPFLFELAGDAAVPGRAAIVALLVSIGSEAVERCEDDYGGPMDHVGAAAVMRERAEAFVGFASDTDPRVRRAAIPGLGLFLDDANRAGAVLRGRLSAEPGIVERLLVVETMATLALRLPTWSDEAMAWLAGLAADSAAGTETRLAAVVQRARCAPAQISQDIVPAAIGLLREVAHATAPPGEWRDSPRRAAPAGGVPPQIVAAFEDLDRQGRVHASTTDLMRTFHRALAARIPQRTALLAEQLRSPDPGSRLDAIRMSAELMKSWRGDHTSLIMLVAEHLDATDQEVAAEAAAVLEACHPIAEPAREALAAHVLAQRAAYGPDVWAAPQPHLRRAHQKAVRGLARLGDARAVPSLLTALDSGVDDWRAVQVAGTLPEAADRLVPRLCDHLRRVDLAQQRFEMSARSMLSALAALGDQAALPLIADTLAAAVRHQQWDITCSALEALKVFGSAAAPALGAIRPLTASSDAHVRPAAVSALWAIGGDQEEVMPLLHDLLEDRIPFQISEAADVLGAIGRPAVAALPRLRELLAHDYEWVRVACAAALWEMGGEAEASTVLDTLLQVWAQNPATANHVVACLDRMGLAAESALPQLRSQLALPQRGGRFASIDNDEELQRVSRLIIARLT